jgi:pimeloyl-ACP methyl ester carboxylesterase
MDNIRDCAIRTRDGRRLAFRESGAADGWPVVALHGTPGARNKYDVADRAAARMGLRMISPDRWGYGDSERPRGALLSAYSHDLAALADHLGIDRFAVVGISGGGPFAAAAASCLGRRVAALALIAPVGPFAGTRDPYAEGACTLSGMSAFHAFCFRIAARTPGAIRLAFLAYRLALSGAPHRAIGMAAARAGRIDRETLADPAVRDSLASTFQLGLARGVGGPVLDLALFSRRWDFALSAIEAPTRIWVGTEDRNVPLPAVRGMAQLIPGCGLVEIRGAGHFWITRHYEEVLAWFVRMRDRPQYPAPESTSPEMPNAAQWAAQ